MSISLAQAIELITLEADLLDYGEFKSWLDLYAEDGVYVIPIEHDATNYEGTLNYAYDNAEMRAKRVERLLGGRSISAAPPARTIRLLSRYRMLSANDDMCALRCAQLLTENRHGRERSYAANIEYTLVKKEGALKIQSKVIRLLCSTDALTVVSYIL
ncbi:aromatic-ring-hydroxylating dioxygenase subunit beta [Acetobacter orientalis]|uniref:aromatic-ring-hydroxylating dioxygenase subunit beta n=1 Tax=Acetobacter orientalis TaxID=146474 RepID=UPI0039E98A0F